MILRRIFYFSFLAFTIVSCSQQQADLVFEDFEEEVYSNWEVQGKAFATPVIADTITNLIQQQSPQGDRFAFSVNDDGALNQGKLISKPFKITHKFIDFWIAGGSHPTRACMNLVIDNEVVRSQSGNDQSKLFKASWDVTDLKGQEAIIEIVDAMQGGGNYPSNYVLVDHIVFSNHLPRKDIVFEDFESGSYDQWEVEGEAFPMPRNRTNTYYPITANGYKGKYFAFSFGETHDQKKGRLRSKEFVITRKYIHFLVGGGDHPYKTCVNLLADDSIIHTATGHRSGDLTPMRWDVSNMIGHKAYLEIVDDHSGSWGHIMADDFRFSDNLQPKLKGGQDTQTFSFDKMPLAVRYFLFLIVIPVIALYLRKRLAPLFDPQNAEPVSKEHPFVKQMNDLIDGKEVYLDPQLTPKKAADMLNLPTNDLLALTELHFRCSFYDLINGKRVERFKTELVKPENNDYTLTAIAEQCGFNSKSSFYRIFKKHTGMTPTEFQAQSKRSD